MPFKPEPKSRFIQTIKQTAPRTVAFLVGAAVANDAGGGVPGVPEMVARMHRMVEEENLDLTDFDRAVEAAGPGGNADGARYLAAMEWMHAAAGGIDTVNRIIRDAVLEARRDGAPETFDKDGRPDDWYLPKPVRDLAALSCSDERFGGPILTTNFDPLIELAIRAQGKSAVTQYVDDDLALGRVDTDASARQVIHLHGFWRGSDTYNTRAQLESRRPRLARSLEAVLRSHRLVVVGYGGWDDVLTRLFADLADRVGASPDERFDIVWGFFDTNAERINADNERLYKLVRPMVERGRFTAYRGIDARTVFEKIREKAASQAQNRIEAGNPLPPAHGTAPLAGWSLVDDTFLDSMSELAQAEAAHYYDGALPTWRHALSDRIPVRAHVGWLTEALDADRGASRSSAHLMLAAGGEGKTTSLLQAAVAMARRDGWRVLSRPTAGIGLDADGVLALGPDAHWLLVADDAEDLVRDLRTVAERLHAEGKTNVHLLLAARDTDWNAANGRRLRLHQFLRHPDPLMLRGVDADDAERIVAAWEANDSLGAVAEVEAGRRTRRLLEAVENDRREWRREGSLFGGLLDVRYGAAGLRDHLVALLERLREQPVAGTDRTLYDALVAIAACHSGSGPGIDLKVLADLLGVSRDRIRSAVMKPLGEEAAAVGAGAVARTRHPRVAEGVLAAVAEAFDTDLGEVWARIVRQTVATSASTRGGVDGQSYKYVTHASPKLSASLRMLPAELRDEIVLSVATASVSALPDRLDVMVSAARALRAMGRPPDGASLLRTGLGKASDKVDYQRVIRGYWNEWGTCEGGAGHSERAAVIQFASVSDLLNPSDLNGSRLSKSLSGVAKAFERLVERKRDTWGYALRGAATVGALQAKSKSEYFDYSHHRCDRLGVPNAENLSEALTWVEEGFRQAHSLLDDVEVASLVPIGATTLNALRVALGLGGDVGGQAARTTPKRTRPQGGDRTPTGSL